MRRRLAGAGVALAILCISSSAVAFRPQPTVAGTLAKVAPPRRLAVGQHRAGMLADEGGASFLGRASLPDPPVVHSLVADPAMPVVTYFQDVTGDPSLELQLQAHTEDDDEERYAFVQSYNGIPILGTFALAQLREDLLHYARHFLIRAPHLDTHPKVAAADAQRRAIADVRTFADAARPGQGAPSLAIFYDDDTPVLVWVVPVLSEQPFGSWMVLVDARAGGLRGRQKTSLDAVAGAVTARIEPQCQGDSPTAVQLPFVEWSRGQSTEADGSFSTARSVDVSDVRLSGPYFRIEPFGDPDYSFQTQLHPLPAFNEVDLGHVPLSQVDPFYHANTVRSWLRQRLAEIPDLYAVNALAWTDTRMPIRVNLPSGHQNARCNAFYDYRALNFYVGDAGWHCNNSGQVAKIVYHEYGHGVHDHLTWSRATFDPQVSEGVADYIAATITGDPNITGLLGCNTPLTGRTTTRTCVNHYTYCRSRRCSSHPGDEPHNSAPIICGALWEMRQELGPAAGDHFFLRFLTLASDMASAYEAAIAADDDDDGDPTNGTAHSCAINRAFLGAEGGTPHFPDAVKRAVPCVPTALPAP